MSHKEQMGLRVVLLGSLVPALWAAVRAGAQNAVTPANYLSQATARTTSGQMKVGILPFVDATGTGGSQAGAAISRMVQAEFTHSTHALAYALDLGGLPSQDLDARKAVEIGRTHNVNAVILGTILEAESGESSKGGGTSVLGQFVGADVHVMRATVTLQADLFSVPSGTKIDSFRVTGKDSEKKVGQTAYTRLGDITNHNFSPTNNALGKALQKAVTQLVQKVTADEPQILSKAEAEP
jgi:hypothetical protein